MDPSPTTAIAQEIEAVYRLYAAFAAEMDAETGCGGKLLYAGEPDQACCRLLRAANIAGAASLAASADSAALRGAMREGAIDFVVTSLDEALRILKNEVRKKQPVAVGVAVAPELVMREMLDRGVQPGLLAADLPAGPEVAEFLSRGARRIVPPAGGAGLRVVPIPADWKRPAAEFDAQLLESLAPEDFVHRRWVRLAPRYLSADARRLRSVAGKTGVRDQFYR